MGEDDAGHVPGSGIDFGAVTGLRAVSRVAVRQNGVPAEVRRRLTVRPTERLLRIDGAFEHGQIVVAVDPKRRPVGRPMQVRHVDQGWAVVIDDRGLRTLTRDEQGWAAMLLAYAAAPAAVWRLLDLWGVFRCPRCRAPGRSIAWGLAPGPAGAAETLGGCVTLPFGGDVACSACPTRWDVCRAEHLLAG